MTSVRRGYSLTSLHLSLLLSLSPSSIFPGCTLICPGRKSLLDIRGFDADLGELLLLRVNYGLIVVWDETHIDDLRLTLSIVLSLDRDHLCLLGASEDFIVTARRRFKSFALSEYEVVQVFLVWHRRGGLRTELSHRKIVSLG